MSAQQLITDHLDIWTSAHKTRSIAGRGSNDRLNLHGIKKLRELIYALAANGTLISSNERRDCTYINLDKVTEFIMGQAPAGSECNTDGIGTVFVKTGEFGKFFPEVREWTTKPLKFSQKGDVLICVVGATVGKLNFGIDCAIGRSVAAIRPNEKIVTEYLYIVLVPFTIKLREKSRGSAQGVIGKAELSAVKIRMPDLDEQHRIVTKVDELMAFCDQLEQTQSDNIAAHAQLVEALLSTLTNSADHKELKNNWQRIAEHFDTLFTTEHSIDQLKQTILQLAVMGKLVPQDPNDEPASELLKKIAAEKEKLIKEEKIKKEKPLPEITDEEKPFELPRGWAWCRLPAIGELARGKSKHRPRNDPKLFADGTVPLIQTGDVARSEKTIQTYSALYNDFGLAQSRLWPKGTMCITIAANIADTGLLGFEACFPDSVVGFLPYDKNIPVEYFESFIKVTKDHLEKFAPSTAQKNINLEILGDLLVPCPPANEIKRIVAKIDELMALCDTLKTNIQNAQTTQLALADVLVGQAIA